MPIVPGSHDVVPASYRSNENDWQGSLRRAIRDPAELCARLDLPESYAAAARRAATIFPLLVPEEFLDRMRRRDPHDPLLRQVLPLELENDVVPGYGKDPLEERNTQAVSGMLTKYPGRSLLITTGACAVHCRYCFRRHFPYSESPKSTVQWQPVLQQLRSDPTLEEVILSGGDPLTLLDDRLEWLLHQLGQVPHVRRIRIHTRLPVMIPSRVNGPLLKMLSQPGPVRIVVVHVNHAAELDESVSRACAALRKAGIVLLNQAVLLRGVNDRVEDQVDLSLRLIDCGVIPYYLHQMDAVAGAHHFFVPEAKGRLLLKTMQDRLPGYAVPRYVREVPGEASKRPILL